MKHLFKLVLVVIFFSAFFFQNNTPTSADCGLESPGVCVPGSASISICASDCGGEDNVLGCAEEFGFNDERYCACDDGTCTLNPFTCPFVELDNTCYDYNTGQYIDPYESCGSAGGTTICCSTSLECTGQGLDECLGDEVCIDAGSPSQCTILRGTPKNCEVSSGIYGDCCIDNIVPTPTPPLPTPTPVPIACNAGFTCLDINEGLCLHEGGDIGIWCINPETSETGSCCFPEENPITPTPGPPPAGPWPNTYVPCGGDAEKDPLARPQFHSLRPFQASPCEFRDLGEASELKLYCGNDIIVRETIEVGPSDAARPCTVDGNTLTCEFEIDSIVDVNIDLTDAELPIMGNTQLVPNQINGGRPAPEQFDWNRRVNEYMSWWLEGVPYKADEELIDPDEVNLEYPHRHIEAYAGPIRKLYPLEWVPYGFWNTYPPHPRSDRAGQSRAGELHDQIYMCSLGNDQVPCRWNFSSERYEIIDTRGTDDPADDLSYPVDPKWVTEGGSPESPWMLMTSTDDRLGSILTSALGTPQIPEGEAGQQVSIQEFVFNPTTDTDLLYFAHMEENVGLAELVQRTYRPRSVGQPFGTHEPIVYYNTHRCELIDVRWNTGDDLFGELTSRTSGIAGAQNLTPVNNPDGLQSPVTGESITGDISYRADFQCEFECDGTLVGDTCIDDGCVSSCMSGASYPECQTPPYGGYPDQTGCCRGVCEDDLSCERNALTAASVYTRTPKAEELWQQTVEGESSFMKKMFPKIGVNGMFGEWKDYPAVTAARYWSAKSSDDNVVDVDVFAGDPSTLRPGNEAEIFIPHLGGIYEFAMIMIQDLLRPKVMNSAYLRNGLPPGSGDITPGTCPVAPSGSACAPAALAAIFMEEVPGITQTEALIRGTNASMICWRESRANASVINNSCTYSNDGEDNDSDGCLDGEDYSGNTNGSGEQCEPRLIGGRIFWFDGATVDLSVGLFQHNLLAICADLQEGVDWGWTDPPWCNESTCQPAPWCNLPQNDPQVQDCIDNYSDADFNIREMIRRSSEGTNWGPWCTGVEAVDCGLCS